MLASISRVDFRRQVCNPSEWGRCMTGETTSENTKNDPIVREIIELQRAYFFEKRNVKTERQRKLKEIIERHVRPGDDSDDT